MASYHLDQPSTLHINELPDQSLLHILEFIPHVQLCKCITLVCKKWRLLAYNGYLWRHMSVRPEFCGFQVKMEALLALISIRFGNQLRSIDLPCELLTVPVIEDLANKCPSLRSMTLDFSKATQLMDFSELQAFPSNLRSLCICLSEVVFLEGFMRRVYNFLSPLKVLHLVGTFEASSGEDEIFEVLNIGKIRSHTPNLRIINLFGVPFIDDNHIEMLAHSCIHLETVALNFCLRVTGSTLKHLLQRCKKLKTLLLRHTALLDQYVSQVEWHLSHLDELDISCTELSEACLMDMFTRLPPLSFLAVAFCDFFSDQVFAAMENADKLVNLKSFDAEHTYTLTEAVLSPFIKTRGNTILGLRLNGKPKLSEQFWSSCIPCIPNIRILVLGTAYGWFLGNLSRVHIDQIINLIAHNCQRLQRLEVQWEPDTIRYSDKSSKFIDLLRIKCARLESVTLADGGFYEMVRSNYDRAGRGRVVRPTNKYQTSIQQQLQSFPDLVFN